MLHELINTMISKTIGKYMEYLADNINSEKEIFHITTAVGTRELPKKLSDTIQLGLEKCLEEAEGELFEQSYAKQKQFYAIPKETSVEEIARKKKRLLRTIDDLTKNINREKEIAEKNYEKFNLVIDLDRYPLFGDLDSSALALRRKYCTIIQGFAEEDRTLLLKIVNSKNYLSFNTICSQVEEKISLYEYMIKAKTIAADLEISLNHFQAQLDKYNNLLSVHNMPPSAHDEGAKLIAPFDEQFERQQKILGIQFKYTLLKEYVFNQFTLHLKPLLTNKTVFHAALRDLSHAEEIEECKLRIINILAPVKRTLRGDQLNRLETLYDDILKYKVTADSKRIHLENLINHWQDMVTGGKSNAQAFKASGCTGFFSKNKDQFIEDCLEIVEERRVINPIYATGQ